MKKQLKAKIAKAGGSLKLSSKASSEKLGKDEENQE